MNHISLCDIDGTLCVYTPMETLNIFDILEPRTRRHTLYFGGRHAAANKSMIFEHHQHVLFTHLLLLLLQAIEDTYSSL